MNQSNQPKAPKDSKSKGMRAPHTEELVSHYWGSINNVISLMKSSELKAGLILSFYGILLNFIYQSTGMLMVNDDQDSIMFILISLWVCITVVSVFYCVRCFIPKIEGDFRPNVFFFGDVISKFGDIEQFSKTFLRVSLNENELFDQLGEQIFILSKIAAWKFKNVQRAIRLLAIGLMLLFLTAGYYSLLLMS